MAAITSNYFAGHANIHRKRAGDDGADLAAVLRGFVDELNLRIQQGTGTIAAASLAIAFGTAMTAVTYRVFTNITSVPTAAALGGNPVTALYVLVADKLTTGFTVTVDPGGVPALDITFDWLAREDTRIHTKA